MLTNVSSQVTNVSCEDLPEAVAKIVKRRVGEAGPRASKRRSSSDARSLLTRRSHVETRPVP